MILFQNWIDVKICFIKHIQQIHVTKKIEYKRF